MKRQLRIGLVGAGFIGRAHVYGYTAMPMVFPDASAHPVLELLAEATPELAAAASCVRQVQQNDGMRVSGGPDRCGPAPSRAP